MEILIMAFGVEGNCARTVWATARLGPFKAGKQEFLITLGLFLVCC